MSWMHRICQLFGGELDICYEGVTRSVAKVVLGSSKTRRAILTKRPTSFWAQWSRDEAKSFLVMKQELPKIVKRGAS